MVLYNLTNLTNGSGMGDVALFANNASDGILYGLGIIAIFFIIFMALKKSSDFAEALITSSFLCFIISGILVYGGFLNIIYVLVFLILTAFSALFMWSQKKIY